MRGSYEFVYVAHSEVAYAWGIERGTFNSVLTIDTTCTGVRTVTQLEPLD